MALLAAARRLPRSLRLLNPHRFTTSSSAPSFGNSEASAVPVWDPQSPVRTPPDEQFAAWVTRLRPGFTACDLADAINSEQDPDLALALFRWAALRPGFRHAPASYLAALTAASSGKRPVAAENLIHDILAGACGPDLQLFNACLRFCCDRRSLFPVAFDMFKRMSALPASAACRPNVETYTLLLSAVVRRVRRPPASLVYLHAIRSLSRQMKASGVVPDTYLLNLIIKAYGRCLEIDDALKVFREMPLYGCEPNEFTYGYIVKAMFQKGRTDKGMVYLQEMREKGFVPSGGVYMTAVAGLALEWRFEESRQVLFDMLDSKRKPDMITYRTLLEELCRAARTEDAFVLLEELKERKCGALDQRMYSELLDGLHWISQPHQGNLPRRDRGSASDDRGSDD
ncbi:pentatricopeptide repeat-containing protein At3g25210, mitochondrial [Brachypodium distachyon]|uniref:pentatricopeptide repeat-containing protein At3g25210, mitochondrial n=1 Tax=Brachypodium distachyon TaxID=15368 RepID=UPI00071DF70F|nr:pentatricopeptide repeat-containing protein At3g25210, mitochondrial [Brachypodium distachyon]XP_024312974.1 pentatricopeptide repeat-containing protein At3g25210, mitochondrial [Brachypodium distachyon]XP_024312975.1 pentatricopeptide repeat-containing protein At3g25210, mitochondrial [Brachypodium distachyon]|eukprot:XP_024312973.1 pentatricopeptide repeat-containing protein At3g25210, mitochondrial [Brachypodium distachyon]